MGIGEISADDYNYVLPPEKIAQTPVELRDHSRLLIYENGTAREDFFYHLADYIPSGSKLVFNDTRVIHARLFFWNEHHARIEIFLLEPTSPFNDMQLAVFRHGSSQWRCLVGNARKWREEKLIKRFSFKNGEGVLEAKLIGKMEEDFLVELKWQPESLNLLEVLDACGFMPLPPYIKKKK